MSVTTTTMSEREGGRLPGSVAVVTGAARGLGAEIVRVLVDEGASVVAADVRTVPGDLGPAALVHPTSVDLRDPGSRATLVAEALDRFGTIDILVNNAGIDVTKPFEELTTDEWDAIEEVNLRAPIALARAVYPQMLERGDGHIVNVTSTAAKRAWPNASAYHTTKWGLLAFSYALHAEGRAHGVRVTAVVAGGMRTPFLFERFPDLDPGVLQEPRVVAEAIRYALTVPAGSVVPELSILPMGETSWP